MSRWMLTLALFAQVVLASGQVLMKLAMLCTKRRGAFVTRFCAAVGCMTVYFFLWLGIVNWVPLSQLAPFDALGPILIIVAAHLSLSERLSPRAWLGAALVVAGVAIIAWS